MGRTREMENMEEQSKNLFTNMLKVAKEMNATVTHQKVSRIKGEPLDTVFVASVYRGETPAHEVLDLLESWATKNNNQELLDKIEELSINTEKVD